MSVVIPDVRIAKRSASWKWWVCGLLLLATMINYMDRLTLNLLADTIKKDLDFDVLHYARIEAGFAVAFAVGALLFGWVVDRWNVFWVYPLAVLAWSAAGFFSGFAQGFYTLLLCRFLLGLAESANWPCALRTTQRLLPPGERTMGNSILQSGAAVGAIFIPLVLLALFDPGRPETWRYPFLVVGACGACWVFLWWSSRRRSDLALAVARPSAPGLLAVGQDSRPRLPTGLLVRRFCALVILVVTINMTWHFLRAWLPLYLREVHAYSQKETNLFASAYYVFTDLGALSAGFATLFLARRGFSVHGSRRLVFLVCALLTTLSLTAAFLPAGPVLLGVLLVIGFGSLGVFPNYYSFSQDLTERHQGKVTGTLGCCCWLAMAAWQELIGNLVQHTGSYTVCFVVAGLAPLVGFLALLILWGPTPAPRLEVPVPPDEEHPLSDQRIQPMPAPVEQRVQMVEEGLRRG